MPDGGEFVPVFHIPEAPVLVIEQLPTSVEDHLIVEFEPICTRVGFALICMSGERTFTVAKFESIEPPGPVHDIL
jgi:hypothetical protein